MRALSFHKAFFALDKKEKKKGDGECLDGSYCKSFMFVYHFIRLSEDLKKGITKGRNWLFIER